MDIYIMDRTFKTIAVIDTFKSFLWTDRYNSFGDFEIYTLPSQDILALAQQDNYVWFEQSKHLMIIDERVITSDVEEGDALIIRGRSLESILDRRIVWNQTILNGNFQNAVHQLLLDSIITPTITDRRIPNFVFSPSSDPRITAMTVTAQFTGANLYDVIKQLCEERSIGFRIVLDQYNQFVFSLYMGTDHSYDQTTNPYVVFSPNFDNIINSNYFETNRLLKTSGLVAGEGEGSDRRTATVGGGSGLDRREQYIDARDISSTTDEGDLPEEEYIAQLVQRGKERMAESIFVKTFDGDVEVTQMFVYGDDFAIGDIVQIVNEYNIEATTRIVELIFSANESGNNIVPTFTVIS